MKRAAPWDEAQALTISSSDSSDSDSEEDDVNTIELGKKKGHSINYDTLRKHGYRSGPSVLDVPPPKMIDEREQDWSWSKGEAARSSELHESYEDRERTRAAIVESEKLLNVQTRKEKKDLASREKRKRDLGQASRGKSYVEEEKRLLRNSGIYSGFDT